MRAPGDRRRRLLPGGVPLYAWIYDNGGVAAERYTVVFTGLFGAKKPGEYPYLTLGGEPVEGGVHRLHWGRPPYGELGREIGFQDLSEGCRALVLDVYAGLWDL